MAWRCRAVVVGMCLVLVACSDDLGRRPVAGPRKAVEVISSHTAGIGTLKGPMDVEVAPDGTLYVLDYDDRSEVGTVYAVPRKGRARVVWGFDAPPFPGLDERPDPRAMATGPDGTLYVVDVDSTGIFAIAPDGTRRKVQLQGVPKTHAERMRDHFNLFTELAVDPKDGSIYLARQSGLVRKVSPQGVMTPVAGTDSQDGPREDGIPAVGAYVAVDSLAVDPATGTLYISGYEGGIRAVAADGIIRRVVPVEALPTGGPGPGGRTRGLRLAFSPLNGALYILEPEHHRVLRLDGDHLTPVLGGGQPGGSPLGGPVERAGLGTPYGLAFDRAGNLYVAVNEPPAVLMIGAPLP